MKYTAVQVGFISGTKEWWVFKNDYAWIQKYDLTEEQAREIAKALNKLEDKKWDE